MRSVALLAAFALFNLANASQTEVVIKNETSRPVHIDHFTDNYTDIPMDDIISLDEGIDPGKKAIVHFSFMGIRYPQFLSQIRSNEVEQDGIYLTLDGKRFKITWEGYYPDFEAKELMNTKITSKETKGTHFVFTVREDQKEDD
ncbi:MAG: hypothetical protein WCJ92_07480 [Alphaproteobacteria bacterium]